METLIVQPSSKEQLTALKAIMKALKVDFTIEKSTGSPYSAEFVAKMKKGEEDIKAGRTNKIEPADICNLGMDETDRILSNPAMVRRLDESIQQLKDGKGITISMDDIWK